MSPRFWCSLGLVTRLFVRTVALVALGILLGYTSNSLRSDGVALAEFEAPASCSGPVVHTDPAAAQEECEPELLESRPDAIDGSHAPLTPTSTTGCTNCSEAP